MTEPVWLSGDLPVFLHERLVADFGGLSGVRDRGLLESAMARPRQLHAYASPGLVELAAAYAAGIVRNHPFVDGNKRVGFMLAYIFLVAAPAPFQRMVTGPQRTIRRFRETIRSPQGPTLSGRRAVLRLVDPVLLPGVLSG